MDKVKCLMHNKHIHDSDKTTISLNILKDELKL